MAQSLMSSTATARFGLVSRAVTRRAARAVFLPAGIRHHKAGVGTKRGFSGRQRPVVVVRAEGENAAAAADTVTRTDRLTVELSTEDVRKTIQVCQTRDVQCMINFQLTLPSSPQLDQITPDGSKDAILFITGVALGSKAEELGLVPGVK